tara:strand:+ start:310 stop:618 length:309 start_codon:yes stop_codon:yes gene_type:complete
MRPVDVAWTVLKQSGLQCQIRRSPNCTGKARYYVSDFRRFTDEDFRPGEPSEGYSCEYCAAPLEGRGYEDFYESVIEVDDTGQQVHHPFDVSQYTGDADETG